MALALALARAWDLAMALASAYALAKASMICVHHGIHGHKRLIMHTFSAGSLGMANGVKKRLWIYSSKMGLKLIS